MPEVDEIAMTGVKSYQAIRIVEGNDENNVEDNVSPPATRYLKPIFFLLALAALFGTVGYRRGYKVGSQYSPSIPVLGDSLGGVDDFYEETLKNFSMIARISDELIPVHVDIEEENGDQVGIAGDCEPLGKRPTCVFDKSSWVLNCRVQNANRCDHLEGPSQCHENLAINCAMQGDEAEKNSPPYVTNTFNWYDRKPDNCPNKCANACHRWNQAYTPFWCNKDIYCNCAECYHNDCNFKRDCWARIGYEWSCAKFFKAHY
mmetsp:Transcript_31093/g.47082  ORF Transcript_31093/g.47082 Transcript_31093/m.47082 type:complete len:260 (-) Transcript_31093:267-1046(-)